MRPVAGGGQKRLRFRPDWVACRCRGRPLIRGGTNPTRALSKLYLDPVERHINEAIDSLAHHACLGHIFGSIQRNLALG